MKARESADGVWARYRNLKGILALTVTEAAEVMVGTLRLMVRHPLAAQHLRSERRRVADALRTSRARYSSLFLYAPYGIYTVTDGGLLLSANWALARILGYPSVAAVLALNSLTFYEQPDEWTTVHAAWQDTWPMKSTEVAWRRSNGERVIVALTGRPLPRKPRREQTFEVFVQDVTEERRLEAASRQAHKLEALGRLAAGVAHDFNNLLTAILGYSELAMEDLDPGQPIYADLQAIHHAGTSAASLTRQLLAFAHKQSLRLEVVDLNAIVRASEPLIRSALDNTIVVVMRLDATLDPTTADKVDVEQALLNLCVNAKDAMTPGGGTLTIETANVAADDDTRAPAGSADHTSGRYIRITVTDTGVGMDAATRALIFEPFFTTKPLGRGTGLGLAMVQGLAARLHGRVTVESAPGAGSSFTLCLPATDEEMVGASRPAVPEPPLPGRETILVIEDEPTVRTLAADVLVRQGYRVLVADSPRAAEAIVAERTGVIDLILIDVVLPDMLGPALIAQLRTQASEPFRAIYMSASDSLGHPRDVGGEPFLSKPFSRTELLHTVRSVLDRALS